MVSDALSDAALNRALLARQHLLTRTRTSVSKVLEHLVGLQAQDPKDPYVALWSRVADFDPTSLGKMIEAQEIVRLTLMRGTIHLVTARDATALRPLVQPVLDRMLKAWRRGLAGADAREVAIAGRAALEDGPLTYAGLGKRLAETWAKSEPLALARAVQSLVPLVQVPPRGVWGKSGAARHLPIESLTRKIPAPTLDLEGLVRRYLAAFGPASVQDAQAWSGLTKLAEVFERLRGRLDRFSSRTGTVLYDLPSAPRPDPDLEAPPRFLPVYDNLVLGFRDRSRVVSPEVRVPLVHENAIVHYVLVHGFLGATWNVEEAKARATLTVRPFVPLSRDDRDAIRDEGTRLLRVLASRARSRSVRLASG